MKGDVVPGWVDVRVDTVGTLAEVSTNGWQPFDRVTTSYQWLLDGQPLKGRTGAQLYLRPEWRGHGVSVRVTGSLAGLGATAVTTSKMEVKWQTNTLPALSVHSTGANAWVAQPLWWPEGTTFTYQWFLRRDDGRETVIRGATSATYTRTDGDYFKGLVAVVTARTVDGQTQVVRPPYTAYDNIDVYTTPGEYTYNGGTGEHPARRTPPPRVAARRSGPPRCICGVASSSRPTAGCSTT